MYSTHEKRSSEPDSLWSFLASALSSRRSSPLTSGCFFALRGGRPDGLDIVPIGLAMLKMLRSDFESRSCSDVHSQKVFFFNVTFHVTRFARTFI